LRKEDNNAWGSAGRENCIKKEYSFTLGEHASLDLAVFKDSLDTRNARGFQNTIGKKKKDPSVLIEK
jgi:hypothetical protein